MGGVEVVDGERFHIHIWGLILTVGFWDLVLDVLI